MNIAAVMQQWAKTTENPAPSQVLKTTDDLCMFAQGKENNMNTVTRNCKKSNSIE